MFYSKPNGFVSVRFYFVLIWLLIEESSQNNQLLQIVVLPRVMQFLIRI